MCAQNIRTMGSSCRALALSLLLLGLASDTAAASSSADLNIPINEAKEKNCSYIVRIETTCSAGAETLDHVSLRFGDINSNEVLVRHLNTKHVTQVDPLEPAGLNDQAQKPFRACSVDEFQVMGLCVESPVCYLYLKLTGSDDWRPGFVQVRVLEGST